MSHNKNTLAATYLRKLADEIEQSSDMVVAFVVIHQYIKTQDEGNWGAQQLTRVFSGITVWPSMPDHDTAAILQQGADYVLEEATGKPTPTTH